MSLLKPKIFFPLCLAGIVTGYTAAEFVVPRYFHPTAQTHLTANDIIAAIGNQPNYFRQTISGNYLAGQFAQRHKDWSHAEEYIQRVLSKEIDNPDLQKHSMILSMAAGDTKKSIELAREVLKTDPQNILAVLFVSLENFKANDYEDANKVLGNVEEGNIAAFIIPALKLWADSGLNTFNLSNLNANSFYAYQVLLAGKFLNQKDKALSFADKAFNVKENDLRDLEKYADIFAFYDDKDRALKIYEDVEASGFANEEILEKITRLQNKQPIDDLIEMPDISSPKDGAAYVFQDMAEILLREYSDDSATIFAQMALALNPKLYRNYAIIGEVYKRNDSLNSAIESFQKIGVESDLYSEAQRIIADLYAEQENYDEAIDILNKLYQKDDDVEALVQVGDIYRYQEDYKKANETYSEILSQWEETPEKYWHILYARGMALERLKKFEESEQDLATALKFRPDNPYLLNFLGYSWVDQGKHLDQSLEMISRAVAYKPNDGFITDSLGWVYYKMGQFKDSIPHLERAVELEPYDATINDHLGDAYWQVGRRNEAKFQWQRALNYSDTEDLEEKEKIKSKLVSGLKADNQIEKTISASDSISKPDIN